jgi:hypothetical protein
VTVAGDAERLHWKSDYAWREPDDTSGPDYLDADMKPGEVIDTLRHLKFCNGKAVVEVDKAACAYLIDAVSARHGK